MYIYMYNIYIYIIIHIICIITYRSMEISPPTPPSCPISPADFKDVLPLLCRGHRVPHLLQDAKDLRVARPYAGCVDVAC